MYWVPLLYLLHLKGHLTQKVIDLSTTYYMSLLYFCEIISSSIYCNFMYLLYSLLIIHTTQLSTEEMCFFLSINIIYFILYTAVYTVTTQLSTYTLILYCCETLSFSTCRNIIHLIVYAPLYTYLRFWNFWLYSVFYKHSDFIWLLFHFRLIFILDIR